MAGPQQVVDVDEGLLGQEPQAFRRHLQHLLAVEAFDRDMFSRE